MPELAVGGVAPGGDVLVEESADIERLTATVLRDFQPALHLLGTIDQRLDLRELALGERSQWFVGRIAAVGRLEQDARLVE